MSAHKGGIRVAQKIYIVEDHEIMREMLRETIDGLEGLSVSGAAATAEQALAELQDIEVNLVLIDMSLPGMSGASLVAHLRARQPPVRCLIYSGHRERTYVDQALEAGTQGYVLKGDPAELEGAIARVLNGEMYLSPDLGTYWN